MDLREREVPVGQLYFPFILGKHVLQRGLDPAAERALKVREFHDRDRCISASLHSLRVVPNLDRWWLKENGNLSLVAQGVGVRLTRLLNLGVVQKLLSLRLDLVEGQGSLVPKCKIVSFRCVVGRFSDLGVDLLLKQLVSAKALLFRFHLNKLLANALIQGVAF